jgi:hypothetical protein
MMAFSTLIGFVVGVIRCPWGTWRSLKSIVHYAAETISKPSNVDIQDAQWSKFRGTPKDA